MIKLVVDTNVLISGLFWTGVPTQIVDACKKKRACIFVFSPELLKEYHRILVEFDEPEEKVTQFIKEISPGSYFVNPNYSTRKCRDPKDNMILDTAVAAQADAIVTGDKDLLVLKQFQKIPILKPSAALYRFSLSPRDK